MTRRSNLSTRSRNAVRLRKMRSQYTEEQRENERRKNRLRIARIRASLTDEQREIARKISRLETRNRRARQNNKKIKSEIPSRLTLKTTLKVITKKKRAIKIKTEQETKDGAAEIKTENENQMYADIMAEVQISSQFALSTIIKSEIDIEPTIMVEPKQLYEFEQSLDESVECWRVTETSEDRPF